MFEGKGFEMLLSTALKAMGFDRAVVEVKAEALVEEARSRIEILDRRLANMEKMVAEIHAAQLQLNLTEKETP